MCRPRESCDEVWLPTPAPTPSDGGLGVCRRLREARPGGRPQSCTAARRQGRVRMTMKGPPHRCGAARRAQQQGARTPARRTSRVVRMHLSSARASRGAAMHYPQYLHTRAAEFLVTHTILHPVARARRAPRPVRSPRQSPVLDLSPVVFHQRPLLCGCCAHRAVWLKQASGQSSLVSLEFPIMQTRADGVKHMADLIRLATRHCVGGLGEGHQQHRQCSSAAAGQQHDGQAAL